jgi:TolB-like protein/Tfp pilus assembly protein PilF
VAGIASKGAIDAMTSRPAAIVRFAGELRRRRVFATAGLYVVGAWLTMQAADVFFPAWGIPDTGINVLLAAAIGGFPLALVFGWFFNITAHGLRRTLPVGADGTAEPRPLTGNDYVVLGALVLVAGGILAYAAQRVLALQEAGTAAAESRFDPAKVEKLPNSIAVLPFDNISTDPENEVFSDGISEEVRNRLGQHGELQVIARASMFQFKASDFSIPKISDLLGVRYLLQGSVRMHEDRIRVTARLVADKGTELWSKNYDRILEDVFGIQDEIADLVAAEVAPQIAAGLADSYTPSLEAYTHFLAGRDLIARRNRPAGLEQLEKAVELDPLYAEAQAEYAVSLLMGSPDGPSIRTAAGAIEAALRQDPDLPRALAARGLYFNALPVPEPRAAEQALRKALERDPNMVDAMNWLGQAVRAQGRHDEAGEWLEKAYALDPFNGSAAANMALRTWMNGDPGRAELILRRVLELPRPAHSASMMLFGFYSAAGRLVEAHETARRLLMDGGMAYWLAQSYATLGQFRQAEDWMSRVVENAPDLMWVRTGAIQAQTPYWRGDYAAAAETMSRAWTANRIDRGDLAPIVFQFYGISQALAGDYAGAIDTLETAIPEIVGFNAIDTDETVNAYHALSWAYLQTGDMERSRPLLEAVEREFAQVRGRDPATSGKIFFEAARNALLMGNRELVLERLEQAVDAGWRGYYLNHHDPRWKTLEGDPRYEALMSEVKADVARQRAIVERNDAEDEFPAFADPFGDQ